jgi:hypothetical protein
VSDNHRVVAEELAEIKEKHEEELQHANQKWWEMFRGPRMPYRIALGVSLQALQQLTGANYFFYYGTVIFKSTGINNVRTHNSLLHFDALRPFAPQTRRTNTVLVLRNANDLGWRQFWNNIHWLVRCRALWPSKVPYLRSRLDVCLVRMPGIV